MNVYFFLICLLQKTLPGADTYIALNSRSGGLFFVDKKFFGEASFSPNIYKPDFARKIAAATAFGWLICRENFPSHFSWRFTQLCGMGLSNKVPL